MDTAQHLDLILPSKGWRCVGSLDNGRFNNLYGQDNAWAVATAQRISEKGYDAYIAMAGLAGPGSRTQENAAWMRSNWIDVDTRESKPAEKYATRKEAVVELHKFCALIGLPLPFVSSSGYGLHIWWVYDQDVPSDQWKITACPASAPMRQIEGIG